MKARPELLPVSAIANDAGFAKTSLAVVSPCSKCQNFQALPTDDNPGCPRRYWQSRADEISKSNSPEEPPAPYLIRKGREDEAAGFENPVSWEAGQLRIVWVATLEENRAVLNSDGSLKNPDILSPNFDTHFITCRTTPYIPALREGDYYAGTQLVEGDWVLLQSVKIPQMDATVPTNGDPVKIGGFCQKVTPLQKAVITPAQKSVNPRGI